MAVTPEQCVIGAMVYQPSSILYCIDHLKADDFADGSCAAAFAEIRDMYTQRGYFGKDDYVLMKNRDTVLYCMQVLPSITGYRKFVAAVRNASICRKAAALGLEIATSDKSVDELRGLSAMLSDVLTEDSIDDRCMTIAEAAGRWLKEQNDKTDHSIKTGLAPLDKRVNIRMGDMLVVGGRPSAGKTALGLQLAIQFARQGKQVCFFSYETNQVSLFDKLISCFAIIPFEDIIKKRRAPQDEEYAKACDMVSQLPIWLINAGGQSVSWVSATAAAKKADVVIVDYLQLIPGRGSSRYEVVTNISMQLHTMAQTTGRLVVALAQINRGGADAPKVQDLKESGQIEQDADAIILLGKGEEEYYFSLAKNKRGITGDLHITFDGNYQRFSEVTDYE